MNKSILNYAILMENKLNAKFKSQSDPYQLKYASIWLLNEAGKLVRIRKSMDVYELLESPKTLMAVKDCESFTLVTCGWAAPIDNKTVDNDVAPSQHPEKRRIRLTISVDYSGVASVMRFKDNPYEIITDEGSAKGSLADAIMNLMDLKVNLALINRKDFN